MAICYKSHESKIAMAIWQLVDTGRQYQSTNGGDWLKLKQQLERLPITNKEVNDI